MDSNNSTMQKNVGKRSLEIEVAMEGKINEEPMKTIETLVETTTSPVFLSKGKPEEEINVTGTRNYSSVSNKRQRIRAEIDGLPEASHFSTTTASLSSSKKQQQQQRQSREKNNRDRKSINLDALSNRQRKLALRRDNNRLIEAVKRSSSKDSNQDKITNNHGRVEIKIDESESFFSETFNFNERHQRSNLVPRSQQQLDKKTSTQQNTKDMKILAKCPYCDAKFPKDIIESHKSYACANRPELESRKLLKVPKQILDIESFNRKYKETKPRRTHSEERLSLSLSSSSSIVSTNEVELNPNSSSSGKEQDKTKTIEEIYTSSAAKSKENNENGGSSVSNNGKINDSSSNNLISSGSNPNLFSSDGKKKMTKKERKAAIAAENAVSRQLIMFLKNKNVEASKKLYQEMKDQNTKLKLDTLPTLLKIFAADGDVKLVMSVFEYFKTKHEVIDESSYALYLRILLDKNQIESAISVLTTMKELDIKLKRRTYSPFLQYFSKQGDAIEMLRYFQEMISITPIHPILPTEVEYVFLLQGCLLAKDIDSFHQVEEHMKEHLLDFPQEIIIEMIKIYETINKEEAFMEIVEEETITSKISLQSENNDDNNNNYNNNKNSKGRAIKEQEIECNTSNGSGMEMEEKEMEKGKEIKEVKEEEKNELTLLNEEEKTISSNNANRISTLSSHHSSSLSSSSSSSSHPLLPYSVTNNTNINEEGFCIHCHHQLDSIHIKQEDRNILMQSIETLVLQDEKRKQNWSGFKNWLKRKRVQEYDFFLDGANIGYFKKNYDNADPWIDFEQIDGMLDHLHSQNKTGLIFLHARHLQDGNNRRTLPPKYRPLVQKWRASQSLFEVPHRNNDDWYWMYATLYRGPGVHLITNDLMRDHKFQTYTSRIFNRWRERHTANFDIVAVPPSFQKHYTLELPPVYTRIMQVSSDKNYIHIPHQRKTLPNEPSVTEKIESMNDWLGIRETNRYERSQSDSSKTKENISEKEQRNNNKDYTSNLWLCIHRKVQ